MTSHWGGPSARRFLRPSSGWLPGRHSARLEIERSIRMETRVNRPRQLPTDLPTSRRDPFLHFFLLLVACRIFLQSCCLISPRKAISFQRSLVTFSAQSLAVLAHSG